MAAVSNRKLLVVSTLDPLSHTSFSGSLRQLCLELKRQGALAGMVHADIPHLRPNGLWQKLLCRIKMEPRYVMEHRWTWSKETIEKRQELLSQQLKVAPPHDGLLIYGTDLNLPPNSKPFGIGLDATYAQMSRSGQNPFPSDRWSEIDFRRKHQCTLFKRAARIFPRSQWCADSLMYDYGVPVDKIAITGAGPIIQPPPNFIKTLDGRSLLFVGLDWQRKQGQLVLDAFALARRELKDIELDVVGRWRPDSPIPGVTFHGYIAPENPSRLQELFSKASVFLMPSAFESWGNAGIEALAFGCPVIMLDRCAGAEIVEDREVGTLIRKDEPWIIANTIIEWLSNQQQLKTASLAARNLVATKFSWEIATRRIVEGLL